MGNEKIKWNKSMKMMTMLRSMTMKYENDDNDEKYTDDEYDDIVNRLNILHRRKMMKMKDIMTMTQLMNMIKNDYKWNRQQWQQKHENDVNEDNAVDYRENASDEHDEQCWQW